MNILLWIALIGVIVFLLGLAYSRYSKAATKQPATKTISPAISPAPSSITSPTPAIKASKPLEGAVAEVKSAADIQPRVTEKPAVAKPAPVKAPAPAIKIVPAAEPVGPAHTQPNQAAIANTTATPTEKPASKPAAPEAPAPAVEPERLKKPRHDKADDLTQITGIGKAIQIKLFSAGIYHYDQLLGLSKVQTTWINNVIGFAGRYERENWSTQAKKLAAKSSTATAEAPKRTPKAPAKVATKAAGKAVGKPSVVKTKVEAKPKAKTVKKPTTAQ